MRKSILAAALLILGGCTAKEILVTEPVSLDVKIEQVKGSKIVFTITPGSEDACYAFDALPMGYQEYDKPDNEMAEYLLSLAGQSYEIRTKEADFRGSFTDMWCYRGSRTYRSTILKPDTDYRLLVYQVNPTTHKLLGDAISQSFHTQPLEMKDLSFTYSMEDNVLTITPSNPDCPYYWDYDSASRIYDSYGLPYGFFYDLIDMYDQYGFVNKVHSLGEESYDFSEDRLLEGWSYILVAGACEDGEIVSKVSILSLQYQNGQLEIIGEDVFPE